MKSNGLFAYAAMARDDNSDTDNTALNGLIMYTKNFACKDSHFLGLFIYNIR
tara:strand:+ start:610 stop:765 length:156 start_codon:yes stop_codon:yes gene_type:complete